ncbi:MAG: FAD-dependent oxidoreductase, partial [Aquabacterium sp.]|nr:FAD-dependent oxidoreductase [Aquabacterium sp.]
EADKIIIATGSEPARLPFFDFDQPTVLTSTSALELTKIPESLLIIGAGVIGCEFASVFSELGTKITIVEMMPQMLPLEDKRLAKQFQGIFKKKGIEVLLLIDRVDEWMLSHLYEFEGKELQSVAKGGVDLDKLLDDDEKKQAEAVAESFKPTLDKLKAALADRAKDVRVTTRLVDSPACLVTDEGDMSGHLARMLKQAGQTAPKTQPILEVNAEHALVKRMAADDARFDDLAHILFDQALLAEGGQLDDPAAYVARVTKLLSA